MYLVTVSFRIVPEHAGAFLARVLDQARDSLTEAGCRRFEVYTDPELAVRFFLYEVYEDRAAFDAHLQTAHYKAFDAEVRGWVEEKAVETAVLTPG